MGAGASGDGALACRRPGSGRLRVASLLEALLDGQLRGGFRPPAEGLDPLLGAWEKALGPGQGRLDLDEEEQERLTVATHHWREAVAGRVAPARACLELFTPEEGEELWELRFSLQAEADPSLRVPARTVWNAGDGMLQLGEVEVAEPGQLLLEGMGRALQVFEPIERGLDAAAPETMQLTPAPRLSCWCAPPPPGCVTWAWACCCPPASAVAWPAGWAFRSRPSCRNAPGASPSAKASTGGGS